MNISTASLSDFDAICALLSDNGLPTEDLEQQSLKLFRVARENDRVIGAIGLERHGRAVLLRSLVVDAKQRGRGLGEALTSSAEALAEQLGASSIFLLTTTAAEFFAARGFRVIPREQVPDAIKATTEFASLCPATATLMVKP